MAFRTAGAETEGVWPHGPLRGKGGLPGLDVWPLRCQGRDLSFQSGSQAWMCSVGLSSCCSASFIDIPASRPTTGCRRIQVWPPQTVQ